MDTSIVLTKGRFWAIEPTIAQGYLELIAGISPSEAVRLQEDFLARQRARTTTEEKPYRVKDGVAILGIHGVMTRAESCAGSLFGGEAVTPLISRDVTMASQDPDVNAIVLNVDSPGGEIGGVAELAASVDKAKRVKPVYAVVNELAASAAMWAIAPATKIMGPKTAQNGNVGVYTVLRDTSRLMNNSGITTHLVASSELKGMGERGVPITTQQLHYMHERIQSLADQFYNDVQGYRKLSDDQMAEIKLAKTYLMKDAIPLGLADEIGSFDDVMKMAAKKSKTYSIGGGKIMGLKLGDIAKFLGVQPTEDATEKALEEQELPLSAVLSDDEVKIMEWVRAENITLDQLQAARDHIAAELTQAREKASRLAVAMFDGDDDAIQAAEESINSADLVLVNAISAQYEASLRKMGLIDEKGERTTAAAPADGDDDRTVTSGDATNQRASLEQRVAQMEREIRAISPAG